MVRISVRSVNRHIERTKVNFWGKRPVTVDTALRLAEFFGTTSGFWLGMQADYDTEEAAKELSDLLAQMHRFGPIAA